METISFRIEEQLKEELAFVKATLNANQSQAIKEAIHAFYQHLQSQERLKKSPQTILKETGFIGSFKGEKDLSVNYKKYLTRGWKAKYEDKKRVLDH